MAQLVRSNQALYDVCMVYNLPLISGKDSMKNDFYDGSVKISIPPTLLFSVIGKIDDVRKAVTMDVKRPGDLVYLLGPTANELGASEYFTMKGFIGNNVPKVDAAAAYERYLAYHEAVNNGFVASCHDLSDGGLAVAAAESAFAGGFGMSIDLSCVAWSGPEEGWTDEALLFSESASRLLVTVRREDHESFEAIMGDTCWSKIGVVTEDQHLTIEAIEGHHVVSERLVELKEIWQSTLREL
jgi:phosphoribosylformylglycinamidine synthase